ncbi:hypothetical protein BC629DRAFT_121400 [Irpex lacteus]|nr:hypothetical protein BC629DRAFT_121400 [Irpex lacteus]
MPQNAIVEGASSQRSATQTAPAESIAPARQRFAMRPLRRSSSRIQRWVQDQQKRQSTGSADDNCSEDSHDTEMPLPSSSKIDSHAYLAYPHLNVQRVSPADDKDIEDSYVFVEEGKSLPPATAADAVTQRVRQQEVVDLSSPPPTSRKSRLLPSGFTPPSPLRTLSRGITQARTFSGSTTNPTRETSPSPSPPRTSSSIFKRQSRISLQAGRTSSLAGALFAQRQARETTSDATTVASSTSNWGVPVKPPSVMGHFSTASEASRAEFTRLPRPSTSSTVTRSSETTHTRLSTDTDNSGVPSRYGRPAAKSTTTSSTVSRPSRSLWSLSPDASHMNDPPGCTKMLAKQPTSSARIPLDRIPNNSVLTLTKGRKKRKLIVSGITPGDQRRYDHLRQWCESFGELNQITRVPNGDLHVDFRSAEVADTVCRIHAAVHINGVGTVSLSWYTGKRP